MRALKAPTFNLTIGGLDFSSDPLRTFVHKIEVDRVSNGMSTFKVELVDKEGKFSNAGSIVEGASCEISLGFVEDGVAKVIEGVVTGVKTEHVKSSYVKLVVSGADNLYRLSRGRKRNSWEEIKDCDLASDIVGKVGLGIDAEDCGLINSYVAQNNITNLAFMFERGKRIGYHVRAEDSTVIFKKPDRHAAPSFQLSPNVAKEGSCIIIENYNILPNAANSVKKVIVRSYDPKTSEPIIGSAENVDSMGGSTDAGTAAADTMTGGDTTRQYSEENVRSTEEADLLAQAKLDLMADEFIDATVKVEGNGNIKPAIVVELQDVGDDYNGNYFVQKVTHTFNSSSVNRGFGYWTALELSRTGH